LFNKIYAKVKKVSILLVIASTFLCELPFYVDAPGGFINVSSRLNDDKKGSLNMAYVSELNGNVVTLLFASLNPKWDIFKKNDDLLENQTYNDLIYQNKLLKESSDINAKIVAYRKLGKKIEINRSSFYVTYSKSSLKVKDNILKIDDYEIENINDITNYIKGKKKVKITILRNEKEVVLEESIINDKLGIIVCEVPSIKEYPTLDLGTESDESGPSGGLMTALAIYNYLSKEDITKGHKIIGTGTIDKDGNVGSIGGVKYKLAGAVKNNFKYFIIPKGDNYNEAIRIKEKQNYDIEIIPVSTFDEAITFLKNL
jgi:PDZ domain-containing protein